MDKTQLITYLEMARALIASHGIVEYMSEYSKNRLGHPTTGDELFLRYEFCLDPKKPTWEASNSSLTLSLDFHPGESFEADGDTHKIYTSRVRLSHSSGEVTLKTVQRRENMMASMIMLMEMLTTTLPDKVTVLVATAQQKAEAAQKQKLKEIGRELGRFLDHAATKGLRTGGKSRTVPLPPKYVERNGVFPEEGVYPYSQVRRYNRRGDAAEVANYSLAVRVNYAGEYVIRINRV